MTGTRAAGSWRNGTWWTNERLRRALSLVALAALLTLALSLRLVNLVPPDRGLLFTADNDEGAYAADARLALDGFVTYRDYFCAAPPAALYLFMATLAPTSQAWGSAAGYMALRYMAVVYGMITIVACFVIARKLGGWQVGLLAIALLAIDGWQVAQDRRAMLEAPMNMFSALGMLAFVIAAQSDRHKLRWYALAGVMGGLAALSKTPGAFFLAALFLALLLQRYWRYALALLLAGGATYIVLSLPYLILAGEDYIRQMFFFQFLRPPNGDPLWLRRFWSIRDYAESWLTVRLGIFGAGVIALRWLWIVARRVQGRLQQRQIAEEAHPDRWLAVVLWAAIVAASFGTSRSYYYYYYSQLAVPLAMLGGSLLEAWPELWLTLRGRRLRLDPRWLIIAAIVALAIWRLPMQLQATMVQVNGVKPAYAEAGQYLSENTPPGSHILVFEPNYPFIGSRPLTQLADGQWLVDTHAYMLYTGLNIAGQPLPNLLKRMAQKPPPDEQSVLWQQHIQDDIIDAYNDADYVVVDRRASYLLRPEVLAFIMDNTEEMANLSGVSVRKKQ